MANSTMQPDPVHEPGTRKGEDVKDKEGKESGRQDEGATGNKRPAGTSTARDSTKINPQDPIDPDSPNMPPA